jgi:SOS response associated peptidase (SRAP)
MWLPRKRVFEPMRWGLVPGWWQKSLKELKLATFNGRIETVTTKPFFRTAFKRKRCLIPASGYYEWRDVVGLGALDCVLRVITASAMHLPFVINILCIHLAADDEIGLQAFSIFQHAASLVHRGCCGAEMRLIQRPVLPASLVFRNGFLHLLDCEDRMRVGSARAHLGCYPDRLHKFLPRRAMPHGGFGVATDAVGALRDMSDRDGDQLLCLDRQGAFGEYFLAECLKSVVDLGSELLARIGHGSRKCGVKWVGHDVSFLRRC